MEPENWISALGAGIVIGLIARILVPSMQPVGCLLTIILGIAGAFIGIAVASAAGYLGSFWLVFLTQILIATLLVAITAAIFRKAGP